MRYNIGELAELAGVSVRTLRHYEQIGLLAPKRGENGYRVYGPSEVKKLQHILFYRRLGLGLEKIRRAITDPGFDSVAVLTSHLTELSRRRIELDTLIANVQKSIKERQGEYIMSDDERFEGLKRRLVEQNERQYGSEVRAQYGDDVMNLVNQKIGRMSESQFEEAKRLERDVLDALFMAMKSGDARSESAKELVRIHRDWLRCYWPVYTAEMHAALSESYVTDKRFSDYYSKAGEGAAAFLRDAIVNFSSKLE